MTVTMPGDLGTLELRKVPDDNSCLFSAIGVVFEGGIEAAGKLRKVVVDAIRKDPETYSEVMLGYVLPPIRSPLPRSNSENIFKRRTSTH